MAEYCALCEEGPLDRRDIHFINVGGYTWTATVGPICAKCREGLKKYEITKVLEKEVKK